MESVTCPRCRRTSVMTEETMDAMFEEYHERVCCVYCGKVFDPEKERAPDSDRERCDDDVEIRD